MIDLSTRDTILTVAARLFASQGYTAVSMSDVAADVGVTKANLYHHFKDKDQLIRETLAHVFSRKTSSLDDALRSSMSSNERLEACAAWLVNLFFDDETFSRLLLRELLDGDTARLEYLSKTVFERPFTLITNVITENTSGADPTLSAISVVGLILGHYQFSGALPHLPGGRMEHIDPGVVTRHVLAMLRGMLNGSSAGKEP